MNEETLFHLALQESIAERAAFLERMCGGDDALRQRVASLLHAADHPDDFLDDPPVTLVATLEAPSLEEAGCQVGPYKLLRQIGEGGMGTVFLAEQQEPVSRQVALKVIKPGMDSGSIIARFRVERQALELMDHPNIARVLDAGTTERGRPYIVMELVQGVPITQYCDEQRLSPKQRLELFIQVCLAVQHAHQKGIIHRDLKPSNVLVALYDGKPVPKVIDFGVAKATGQQMTDKTMFTGLGGLVGTLEYMSPEQAELDQLDIDTRSDVYSLGVLLYELLTGTTPLQRKRVRQTGILDLLRLIREEEPPKPSMRLSTVEELPSIAAQRSLESKKLSGLVRGDLDWIVMKCLEKDRNRRYETANGLAADVQRYLADEPVLACPPSAVYRLRKFTRRHQAGLLMMAVVLLAGVVAVGGVGWALWDRQARQAARGLDQAAQRLEQAKRSAETERAVSVALTKAGQLAEQAQKMPSVSSEEAAAVLVVWRQASDALAQGEAVLSTGPVDDTLRQSVATLRTQLEEGQQQAEQESTRLLRKERLSRNLFEARLERSLWVKNQFNYGGAARKYAAAFAAYGLDVAGGSTDELARRISGEEPTVRDELIVALDDWAFVAAPAQSKPSASDLRALAQAADQDTWRRRYRTAVRNNDLATLRTLSTEAQQSTLPPSSLSLLARSLEWRHEHAAALAVLRWGCVRHPTDFWLHFELGTLLGETKGKTALEMEEALGCFRVALAVRPKASVVHNNLGNILMAKKQWDEALVAFEMAIQYDSKLAYAHDGRGNALLAKERLDEAIAEYKIAIELDPNEANFHNGLGNAFLAKKQWGKAIDEFNEAIRLDSEFVQAHNDLGLALHGKNQWDAAIAEFRIAIKLDPKYAQAHHNLGLTLKAKEQWEEAIIELRTAIELDSNLANAHHNLGLMLYTKKQWDEAIVEYNKAIELEPKNALFHNNFGNALRAKNQLDEAIAEYKRAIALDSKLAQPHYNLGNLLRVKNQLNEASAEYHKAIDLQPDLAEAHCNLALVLRLQGQLSASLASYKRGHALGSKRKDWGYQSAQWVAKAERLVQLEAQLLDVLSGKATPKDNGERLALLEVCQLQHRHVAAVRLYTEAFIADLKLADDLKAAHRYNAAAFAAQAAAGQGMDADKLDDQERCRLRTQALDWLRADLNLWSKRLEDGKPEDRKMLQGTLLHWQDDAGLTSVRDLEALKKVPTDEQEAWRKLWAYVAELVRKAGDAK